MYVINVLDTGVPIPENIGIHSVAETLLSFIHSLSEPLITYALYLTALSVSTNFTQVWNFENINNDCY
jgi:hypothetical protein